MVTVHLFVQVSRGSNIIIISLVSLLPLNCYTYFKSQSCAIEASKLKAWNIAPLIRIAPSDAEFVKTNAAMPKDVRGLRVLENHFSGTAEMSDE
jgi:hypothetical protein